MNRPEVVRAISDDNEGEDDFERGYIEGVRRARIEQLRHAIRVILGDGGDAEMEARAAQWIVEREEAIARLRGICAEHGDNDWTDNMHIADVIEKHLAGYLNGEDE